MSVLFESEQEYRNIKEENTTKNLFTKMAYKKLTIISSTRIFEASS